MPRNKLIQERIELRWWQPLDRLPRRPHFQHVCWAVYGIDPRGVLRTFVGISPLLPDGGFDGSIRPKIAGSVSSWKLESRL